MAQHAPARGQPLVEPSGNREPRRRAPHRRRQPRRARASAGSAGTSTSAKPGSSSRDPHFAPARLAALGNTERQVVEQLVGEHHATELERGQLLERDEDRAGSRDGSRGFVTSRPGERAERLVGRIELQPPALFVAQRGGALHQDVVQRPFAVGTRALNVASQAAAARAGFDHDERVGLSERAPVPVERTGNARAEQRADLGAGDEVAAGAARAVPGLEEAGAGCVQRELDETVEGDRALAPDEAGDRVGGRAG